MFDHTTFDCRNIYTKIFNFLIINILKVLRKNYFLCNLQSVHIVSSIFLVIFKTKTNRGYSRVLIIRIPKPVKCVVILIMR